MLNKSFVAIAMLSFVFTATAFGQKEIVIWSQAKDAKNVERKTNSSTPRQTAFTGSDEEIGALIAWKQANQKPGRKPKTGNLIDTSTGEIVWAKGNNPNSAKVNSTASSSGSVNQRSKKPRPNGWSLGASNPTIVGSNQRAAQNGRTQRNQSSIYSSNPGQGLLGRQKQR